MAKIPFLLAWPLCRDCACSIGRIVTRWKKEEEQEEEEKANFLTPQRTYRKRRKKNKCGKSYHNIYYIGGYEALIISHDHFTAQ